MKVKAILEVDEDSDIPMVLGELKHVIDAYNERFSTYLKGVVSVEMLSQLPVEAVMPSDLDYIAVEVSNSRHGDFLRTFATAWQRADIENRQILRPAWLLFIEKYRLDKEFPRKVKKT